VPRFMSRVIVPQSRRAREDAGRERGVCGGLMVRESLGTTRALQVPR
jgi:hypothetical protein